MRTPQHAKSERKSETVVSAPRLGQVLHPGLCDKTEEERDREKLEMKHMVVKMEVFMKGLEGKSGSLSKNGKTETADRKEHVRKFSACSST